MYTDLRYALRQLRSNPGFTAVAVLTLALGIGANTAIFSLIHAAMLKTLAVRDPKSLVILAPKQQAGNALISYPVFEELRQRQRALVGLAATSGAERLTARLEISDQPQCLMGSLVSANYFSLLGVDMKLGRGFAPADEALSAPPVAIISHGLWERRFAGDPAVMGKTILLNSTPVTIVGVTPLAFRGDMLGIGQDVWALLMHFRRPEDLRNRASRYEVFGLVLKQGMLTGLTGVAAGLVLAFGVTRLMSRLLYGVSAPDPLTYALIALLFALVTLLACYLPARRATRVDPMVALI